MQLMWAVCSVTLSYFRGILGYIRLTEARPSDRPFLTKCIPSFFMSSIQVTSSRPASAYLEVQDITRVHGRAVGDWHHVGIARVLSFLFGGSRCFLHLAATLVFLKKFPHNFWRPCIMKPGNFIAVARYKRVACVSMGYSVSR
jgi:hypothetical protein